MAKSYEELSAERKALQERGLYPEWYTTMAYQMFTQRYAYKGEAGVRDRWRTIARTLAPYAPGDTRDWEEKFFQLMWRGWFSPASPVLANTGTDRGLNVSCSGGVVPDSIEGFYEQLKEQALLSKYGFGCSGDFNGIRPRGSSISTGGKASGAVPVIEDFATMTAKVTQGGNRRGSTASYISIEHGDFHELADKLESTPDGLNIGWTITDEFIQKLKDGDKEANERWSRALYVKLVTGKGYFFKIDAANAKRPQMYKDKGLDIKASNLCAEIMLHSSEELSFSCILSSMNLAKYDEWKDTDAVFEAMVFLDCLTSDFLAKSENLPGLDKVREFTLRGRAVGLGVMGFGTYLQSKGIAYESLDALFLNDSIFKQLHDETLRASQWLAEKLGEPEWCKGYGVRNTHRTALAPTKSSSILMGGVSESVFPDPAMVFEQSSAAGGMKRISPGLYKFLTENNLYYDSIIEDIVSNMGSVQHVAWLSPEEKEVYKNAFEVNQEVILRLASQRQKWLCQGQSLNFFFAEDEDTISDIHTKALLDPNILSMYYVYSRSGVIVNTECTACSA